MATGVSAWSKTAATNNTADSAVNWQEGQAPSSVNDSARGMMAATAKWRDDLNGSITTSGTSSAYTVSTNQGFGALTGGYEVTFVAHVTNSAAPTLNVDSLGAKPIRSAAGTEIPSGVLVAGTPYRATYYSSNSGEWVLHGFFNSPFLIPLGGGMDYWGGSVPHSSFAFPTGQAISRTTYSELFAIIGTTHGSGDGSTTFNLPDKTGRVSAMKEASATRLTSAHFGGNSTNLGATGGSESHTLTTAQLASHTHANTLSDAGHSHNLHAPNALGVATGSSFITGHNANGFANGAAIFIGATDTQSSSGVSISNAAAGSGSAHNNVQPTIVCNYILRII